MQERKFHVSWNNHPNPSHPELVGALPTWPHSASWGYFPSGALGTILIVVLILVLLGRI
jgi:hypothetical protein